MNMLLNITILLHLFNLLYAQSITDRTLTIEATGRDVVFTTITKISDSLVFPDDNRFLRRVAFAESRDGLDPDTFREGYNGGIWQVDEEIFQQTQNVTLNPVLISIGGIYERLIGGSLGVDWLAVTWQDLRVPLYSALAARIFFELADPDIPPIGNVRGQGEFWKSSGFNNNSIDTVESFVEAITNLELEECPNRGIDLAFLLDSSGSVGENNFELEKQLVLNIVDRFSIGPDATRVAVVSYSGFAVVNFLFNNFTTREDVRKAVQQVEYFDIAVYSGRFRTSTNTADGLTQLRTEVFNVERGARPSDLAIPRVAVVISDGRSNVNQSQTIPAARALRKDGVTVYSVGVGDKINLVELNEIASSPDNVMLLNGFDVTEFDGLRSRITADACITTVPVQIAQLLNIEIGESQVSFFEFELPNEGMTISLRRQTGRMMLYASSKVQNPSSAFYEYRIQNEGEVYIDPYRLFFNKFQKRETTGIVLNTTLYVSVEGGDTSNKFQIRTSLGNTINYGKYRVSSALHLSLSLWNLCLVLLLLFIHR